jgi:thiol-disulfide isomerase/thioredoxin
MCGLPVGRIVSEIQPQRIGSSASGVALAELPVSQPRGQGMKRLLYLSIALVICCVAPFAQAKRAPNLEFTNLSGQTQKISDLRGSIAVINFWATWCAPCREELPLLSKLSQEYAGKKVRFITISADEDPGNHKNRAKIDLFLSHEKPATEIWLGADLDMLDRLNLGNVLPATVIVDEQGEIIARILGEAHEEDVKAPVEWLLNDRSGTAPVAIVKRY